MYNVIIEIKNKIREYAEIVERIFTIVGNIARGDTQDVSTKIEDTLGSFVPKAIGFLASLIGVGDIPKTIGSTVESVQDKVTDVIRSIVRYAKNLVLTGTEKVKTTIENLLYSITKFSANDGDEHTIWSEGEIGNAEFFIKSETQPLEVFLTNLKNNPSLSESKKIAVDDALSVFKHMEAIDHSSISDEEKSSKISEKQKEIANLIKSNDLFASDNGEGGEGTHDDPILVNWPKPATNLYPTLYVGPKLHKKFLNMI